MRLLSVTPLATRFQNTLAEIDETCVAIREEAAKYSDGDELVDADMTAALAWLNALRSIEVLIRGANAH